MPMPDRIRNSKYYDLVNVQDELYARSCRGENFYDLMQYINSRENILMAYRNIKKNGGSKTPGVDGKDITYLGNMTEEQYLKTIRAKLQWFVPKPVKRVEIPKTGDPTKTRPLGIPCIVDRIVQQCFKQVLEPITEAKFYKYSFGFRPLRSAENAFATCCHTVTFGVMHFVVDVDIKGFFDNVNHDKLIKQLWQLGIKDKKCICIIKEMLKAPIVLPDKTKIYPDKGTPQGGILSPLLANVYLNELDWWIASQWVEFPSKYQYAAPTAMYQSLRRYSNLKEMRIIRYADDFKIFCRDIKTAEKVFEATTAWLKERLYLDISPEKSGITNLRRKWTDFLGFEFKASHKNEIVSNYHQKGVTKKSWVAIGRIKRKALKRIENQLIEQLKLIENPKNDDEQVRNIRIYNQMVMGIHNYYRYASRVYFDLDPLQKRLSNRMFNRIEGFTTIKPIDATIHKEFQERYGKSKMMRYIKQSPIVPIGYIKFNYPSMFDQKANEYSPEGRKHQKAMLGCSIKKIQQLMKQASFGSIEYQDNRISLFSAQKGKCAILNIELEINDIHCHHILPRKLGGTDKYENLIILHRDMHVLIHSTNDETIRYYMQLYNINQKQLTKINKLRDTLNLPHITMWKKQKTK